MISDNLFPVSHAYTQSYNAPSILVKRKGVRMPVMSKPRPMKLIRDLAGFVKKPKVRRKRRNP